MYCHNQYFHFKPTNSLIHRWCFDSCTKIDIIKDIISNTDFRPNKCKTELPKFVKESPFASAIRFTSPQNQ